MSYPRFFLVVTLGTALGLLTGCGEKQAPVMNYAMGEKAEVGHLVYTAFETQWLTQIGQPPDARIPQNRFFLIRLSATNGSGGPVTLGNFTLEDDKGNSFNELSSGEGVPQWMGLIKQINPADSLQGNVVFDVVPKHYKLRVFDENSQRSALIDIPLSFNTETQDLPAPSPIK